MKAKIILASLLLIGIIVLTSFKNKEEISKVDNTQVKTQDFTIDHSSFNEEDEFIVL